jgi:hypothetical protein
VSVPVLVAIAQAMGIPPWGVFGVFVSTRAMVVGLAVQFLGLGIVLGLKLGGLV